MDALPILEVSVSVFLSFLSHTRARARTYCTLIHMHPPNAVLVAYKGVLCFTVHITAATAHRHVRSLHAMCIMHTMYHCCA